METLITVESDTQSQCEQEQIVCGDEHATALYAYFVVFNDFQYSRDLRQHYTTWTMLYDVFRTIGNLPNVIPTISDHFR